MYAMESMDNLANDAEVVSSLKPEDVKIAELNLKDNEVQFVDMSDGKSGTFKEGDAASLIKNMQGKYNKELKEISENMEK